MQRGLKTSYKCEVHWPYITQKQAIVVVSERSVNLSAQGQFLEVGELPIAALHSLSWMPDIW